MLHRGDAVDAYQGWPTPTTIISDGAYGVRGFHGDTIGTDRIAEWYRPHVEAWSRLAGPATTLWFWNTEVGWATVHPLLVQHGWDYVQAITWDKGIAHIAGNVNGKTIRRFPVVSEICVFYQRQFEVTGADGSDARAEVDAARVAAGRASAQPGQRGVRRPQRRDSQVPHPGLAVVLAAGRDDGAPGRLR